MSARVWDYARHECEIAIDDEAMRWFGWPDGCRQAVVQACTQIDWTTLDPRLVLPVNPDHLFFAAVHRETRQLVAGIQIYASEFGRQVGCGVHREFRGQGYGREALRAVCEFAGHFGIGRLLAGCERANVPSQRWLAACGFRQVDGPPVHVLPDGRQIESLWWVRPGQDRPPACRHLRGPGAWLKRWWASL